MINMLRYYLKPLLPLWILKRLKSGYTVEKFEKWQATGCPIPPPHFVKQHMIQEFQRTYGYKVLIESGTFLGDMVAAQKDNFTKIISIELNGFLFRKAFKRFKYNAHIHIVQGDSGKMLQGIMNDIYEPCLFWLDGHYSSGVTARGEKDCPIFEELNAIFSADRRFNHILLIDDARLFTGKAGYPLVEELTNFIKSRNENYMVGIKNDVISYTTP